MIERNGFYFLIKSADIIEIWYGEPNEPESEFVGSFHKVFLPAIIAGLTALKQSL